MTAPPQRQKLVEIRALTHELSRGFDEVLKRIKEAQEQLAPRDHRQVRPEANGDDTSPLIAFVHIPKTAGGTVTSMFASAYSKKGLHKAGNYFRGPDKTLNKVAKRPGGWESWHRRGGRLSVGHVPYGLFRDHLPADTSFMTFLREPLDRVLSHYYRHVHRPPERSRGDERSGPSPRGRIVKADSIEEALVELRLPDMNNLATRFLCGEASPAGDLPANALGEAKANLREFAFVGIQERFEESIVLLQRTLGLELVPSADRHVSSERPTVEEIPDEQRALITEYNQLDLELYAFGQQLFEDAVAAVADDRFAAEVETLRDLNAAANEADRRELQEACDWLDRALPNGSTKAETELRAAAEVAGISESMLKRSARSLGVKKELEDDGPSRWTRTEEAHADQV